MSRVVPGFRIYGDVGDMEPLAVVSSEHWKTHEAWSNFINPAGLNVYNNTLGWVTMVNALSDQFPAGTLRGNIGLGTTLSTVWISTENPLTSPEIVTVVGLDGQGNEIQHEAALSGTNNVQVGPTDTWTIVTRAWYRSAGFSHPNTYVWVHTDPTPNRAGIPGRPEIVNTLAAIPPWETTVPPPPPFQRHSESPMSYYQLPVDREGWITGWSWQAVGQGNNKRREGTFALQTRKLGGIVGDPAAPTRPWRTRRIIGFITDGTSTWLARFHTPIALDPLEEVRIRFIADGNVIVSGCPWILERL